MQAPSGSFPDPRFETILDVAALRELERAHRHAPLMERAGAAAAATARDMAGERGGRIVVLAGPGNNGGDALVVARLLRAAFHEVTVVFRDDASRLPREAATAHQAFVAAGGATEADPPPAGSPVALVVDGLFGVGLKRALAPSHARLVEWANGCGAPILALDVPTGLDADTGIAMAPVIRADVTATFLALKPGMLTAAGPELCGRVQLHTLGVAPDAAAVQGRCLRWAAVAQALPHVLARDTVNVHKGSFGTLGVVGGGDGMLGAPLLAARAALRLGAGRVVVGFVATSHPAVDLACPELMLGDAGAALGAANALVVGPGMGRGDAARGHLADALDGDLPLVLDADALNLVAQDAALRAALRTRSATRLLTPHPAEAARLLDTEVAAIQHDRLAAARKLASAFGAHVVVKGAGSVVAHPDGRYAINASGSAALASAGTGDVLAGMAGALLAQRVDPAEALEVAVCLHGAAADDLVARGTGPVGLPASMLADAARDLVNRATRAPPAVRE